MRWGLLTGRLLSTFRLLNRHSDLIAATQTKAVEQLEGLSNERSDSQVSLHRSHRRTPLLVAAAHD